MDDAKQKLVDKLKTANNILVTVSRDPSVDQLASCLGLALLLNKQSKHTAAVFSGQVPSTLEFLKPEETLEKNTDSLRDFIIALDKSKADKLRYKVEDNVVRIFITPYKTSIGQEDLEFSQGDFNVDLVIALGVSSQEDLDEAITAHGRILHDATVASINLESNGNLGSINWSNPGASSLSELVTELSEIIDPSLLDAQIATALLTGIVACTERFRNDKTTPQTMSAGAVLMSAGANQQLVASQLEAPVEPEATAVNDMPTADSESEAPVDDGSIDIEHNPNDQPPEPPAIDLPEPSDDAVQPDDLAAPAAEPTQPLEPPTTDAPLNLSSGSKIMTDAPSLGGTLTANSQPPALDPVTDPFSMPASEPPQLLDHAGQPAANDLTPPPLNWTPPTDNPTPPVVPPAPAPDPVQPPAAPAETLSDIEGEVKASEQQASNEAETVDTARDEVNRALNSAESTLPPKPIEALNAQPMVDLHPTLEEILQEKQPKPAASANNQPAQSPPADNSSANNTQVTNPTAPPPVPPPIPFQFGKNPPQQ